MRQSKLLLSWIERLIVWLVIMLPFGTLITVWLHPSVNIFVSSAWKEVLLVVIGSLCLIVINGHKKLMPQLLKERDVQLCLGFLLTYVLWSALFWRGRETLIGLALGTRFIYIYLIGRFIGAIDPEFYKKAGRIVVGVAAIVAFLAILQTTLLPKDFLAHLGYDRPGVETAGIPPAYHLIAGDEDFVRAQGSLRGPNVLAAFMLLPLALVLPLTKKRDPRRQIGLGCLGLILVAIGLTYSRSAYLATAVILAGYGVYAKIIKPKVLMGLVGGLIILVVLVLSVDNALVKSLFFHADSRSGESASNEGHIRQTIHGAQDLIKDPLGDGPGTAGPASTLDDKSDARIAENYFLQVGQEVGLLGFGLFVLLHAALYKRLYRYRDQPMVLAIFLSLVGLTITNLLLHTWSDESVSLIWWLIAGLAVSGTGILETKVGKHEKSQKKTSQRA